MKEQPKAKAAPLANPAQASRALLRGAGPVSFAPFPVARQLGEEADADADAAGRDIGAGFFVAAGMDECCGVLI